MVDMSSSQHSRPSSGPSSNLPPDDATVAAPSAPSRVPLDHRQLWTKAAVGANTYDFASGRVTPTIYERTTAAALRHEALNLGQGFTDHEGPQWMLETAAAAITDPQQGPGNQYPPGPGLPALREAIAADQQRRWGIELDPTSEVLVTTGATEAITASILAFAAPGTQVLTFEPHYDSYGAVTAIAGAELVGVPLRGPDFRPDIDALEAAITERTSLILLNTPHNPTGTVFSTEELRRIVELARRHDVKIMCDGVYEQLVFDDAAEPHRPILTIPGADEVAVAIGSAGKSFSLTGWKVGWVTGRAELVNQVLGIKQFLSFCSGPAYQWAVATGLADDRGYYAENVAGLQAGRDLLYAGLEAAGLRPNHAEAGYFIVADIRGLTDIGDVEFCRMLVEEVGVAAIPVSSLTVQHRANPQDELQNLVRFAFCKRHETIEAAMDRLAQRLPAALDHRPA